MNISSFCHSEIGPRDENQDTISLKNIEDCFVAGVADGVGGGNCGSIASNQSINYFFETLKINEFDLEKTILATHHNLTILQQNNPKCQGMATTFTATVIAGNLLKGIHAGDSRLCVLRGNGLKQLTTPHTEAERLVRDGRIKREDLSTYPRRNIIESALGIKGTPEVQAFEFKLLAGDRILLTTDGVHDLISKVEFRDMSITTPTIAEFGEKIKQKLSERKLTDNASFILIGFYEDE